nr:BRO family protein [uncultured Cohaesibacter sp.]
MLKKHNTTPTVSTFSFQMNDKTGINLRALSIDNEPWFVAKDICDALGLNHTATALKKLDDFEKRVSGTHFGRGRRPIIVNESGLYKLIMRSDKPEAQSFQKWVTQAVLPAIRKDGMYVKGEEKVVTGEMSMEEMTLKVLEGLQSKVSRLTAEKNALTEDVTRKQFVIEEMHDQVGALSEDNAALEAVKAEMEPMVEGFQHFLSVDGTYNKEAVAKILGFPSAIKLNRWLSYMGIQSARKTWKGGREHIKYWYLRAGWVKRNDLFKTKTSTDVVRGTQVHI